MASPWTRVGYGAFTSGSGVTLTPAIPSGSVGDLLLLFLGEHLGTDTVPAISNWVNISPQANVQTQGIFARIATGSDAVTVPIWGADGNTWAQVVRYSNSNGVVTISTMVTASIDAAATLSGQVNFPGLTIPSDNNLLIMLNVMNFTVAGSWSVPSTGSWFNPYVTASNVSNYAQVIDEWRQTTATNVLSGHQGYSGTANSQLTACIIVSLVWSFTTLMGQACL